MQAHQISKWILILFYLTGTNGTGWLKFGDKCWDSRKGESWAEREPEVKEREDAAPADFKLDKEFPGEAYKWKANFRLDTYLYVLHQKDYNPFTCNLQEFHECQLFIPDPTKTKNAAKCVCNRQYTKRNKTGSECLRKVGTPCFFGTHPQHWNRTYTQLPMMLNRGAVEGQKGNYGDEWPCVKNAVCSPLALKNETGPRGQAVIDMSERIQFTSGVPFEGHQLKPAFYIYLMRQVVKVCVCQQGFMRNGFNMCVPNPKSGRIGKAKSKGLPGPRSLIGSTMTALASLLVYVGAMIMMEL